MKIRLGRLILELCFWFSAELALGFIEMDNLADYCEFLKQREVVASLSSDKSSLHNPVSLRLDTEHGLLLFALLSTPYFRNLSRNLS